MKEPNSMPANLNVCNQVFRKTTTSKYVFMFYIAVQLQTFAHPYDNTLNLKQKREREREGDCVMIAMFLYHHK